ncbi:MAG TPA: hypothetical protein PKD54_09815, partial [Pirellulaceae bacterium]|nr:hypothetical protein [Pirellulaceae bacterium]
MSMIRLNRFGCSFIAAFAAMALWTAVAGAQDADETQIETLDAKSVSVSVAEHRQQRNEKRRLNSIHKTMSPVEGFESVELFSAMEAGEVEVLVRAKDSTSANIIVTNKSDRPLAIEMPAAFAGVPVMRQAGLGGGGAGGMGGMNGGMGGMGGGMGGMGGMG